MISSWLPEVSHACLSYTCRYFRAALEFPPRPHRRVIMRFNLGREAKDSTRQRLTCLQCLRLRRFFHFDRNQAEASQEISSVPISSIPVTGIPQCLDCLSGARKLVGKRATWISGTKMTEYPHCLQVVIYESGGDEFLIIPSHVGAPICARHPHRVRVRNWCARAEDCSDRCETCHWYCSAPTCSRTVHWGTRSCSRGHENHSLVWNIPEQPPSGPEEVVCRLRVRLDREWPPPLKGDVTITSTGTLNLRYR
jgi:hypothetical protein